MRETVVSPVLVSLSTLIWTSISYIRRMSPRPLAATSTRNIPGDVVSDEVINGGRYGMTHTETGIIGHVWWSPILATTMRFCKSTCSTPSIFFFVSGWKFTGIQRRGLRISCTMGFINIRSTMFPNYALSACGQQVVMREITDIDRSQEWDTGLHCLYARNEPADSCAVQLCTNETPYRVVLVHLHDNICRLEAGSFTIRIDNAKNMLYENSAGHSAQGWFYNEVHINIVSKCSRLLSAYTPGYAFPQWAVYQTSHVALRQSRVFHAGTHGLDTIKQLVREREPVNMGMVRHYDEEKMLSLFGFSYGAYGTYVSTHMCTPPTFVVYTLTTVYGIDTPVHILHATGTALDSVSQPDYRLYNAGYLYMKDFYVSMFRLLFASADWVAGKYSTVVLSLVGGGCFADLYKGGRMAMWGEVWIPALSIHMTKYPEHMSRVYGMGFPTEFIRMLPTHLQPLGARLDMGQFPDIVHRLSPTAVYINAWDPWSIVGNGNAMDNSLDGMIGRSSNAGVLSTSLTNPYLEIDSSYVVV